MEDRAIVDLFFARNEEAITETAGKYGSLCLALAKRITGDDGEAEECMNDAYLRLWMTIPPSRPQFLSAFLSKIVRRLAIDRWRKRKAEKRQGETTALLLSELDDCLPARGDAFSPEAWLENKTIGEALDRFLRKRPEKERRLFVLRYFYALSLRDIAEKEGMSENAVTIRLSRTRQALKHVLEEEGLL